MTQMQRILVVLAVAVVFTAGVTAQQRPYVGTVIDIDEGRGRIVIEADDDSERRMTIEVDSVATTYHNFGTFINDKPEIFTGSAGLTNVRLNDRIEVRASMEADVLRASA